MALIGSANPGKPLLTSSTSQDFNHELKNKEKKYMSEEDVPTGAILVELS